MPGDRATALRWAGAARDAREQVRTELRNGERDLAAVLREDRADDHRGAVWLLWVLESRPGVRKIDTRRQLDSLGIDPVTELAQLDGATVELLIERFGR